MGGSKVLRCVAAMVVAACAVPALGCPVCDSDNGRQVRAGVFDEQFGWNLLKVTSPFPVLLGAVGLAYCLMPGRRGREAGGADGDS